MPCLSMRGCTTLTSASSSLCPRELSLSPEDQARKGRKRRANAPGRGRDHTASPVSGREGVECADGWQAAEVELASEEAVTKVHSKDYVRLLASLGRRAKNRSGRPLSPLWRQRFGGGVGSDDSGEPRGEAIDAERSMTRFSAGTFRAALRAAGAACHGVDRVLQGRCACSPVSETGAVCVCVCVCVCVSLSVSVCVCVCRSVCICVCACGRYYR